MIYFKKLRWKNFLSTGNVFTEIELNKHNTTLIVGENGAGKSTILDALTFALFGKPFRKINKPQLLNTITQKGLSVEIEFSIGKIEYKIVRGIKPTVFEVYQNGSLLNQSAESKDYQDILEKQILKINYKSFCQVVVLGSATYQPFMQLTAAQRREIIEDLLDLQIFSTMNSLLKDKVSFNTKDMSECDKNIAVVSERIEMTKKHLIKIQMDNSKLIEDKKERIEKTKKDIDTLSVQFQTITDTIEKLSKKTVNLDKLKLSSKELSSLKSKIENKFDSLKEEIDFFTENDQCPTCKQNIDVSFKETTIKEKTNEISTVENGLSQLIDKYLKVQKKIEDIIKINDQISDNKFEAHKIKTKINSLNEYINDLNEEMSSIKNIVKTEDNVDIKVYEEKLEEYKDEYNKLKNEKELYTCAATMLKDSGIKSRIIKQYVPIINKFINKYLSSMEFMCQFELDENFDEVIKSRYRDEFSYGSFSEGEKFRINLAILFTWRSIAKMRNSINTNILILDEVMDSSLDANGTEEFLKLIKNLSKDTNIFIISHKRDTIIDKFENVIKFEKIHNFSKIA
jgi:DNA repair exonuclease SbcCD ATPase subunit